MISSIFDTKSYLLMLRTVRKKQHCTLIHHPEHALCEWKWHSENLFIMQAQAQTWANIQLQGIS